MVGAKDVAINDGNGCSLRGHKRPTCMSGEGARSHTTQRLVTVSDCVERECYGQEEVGQGEMKFELGRGAMGS